MINISDENVSQEFRLKDVEEIKNYFIKEIEQNEWMSNKHKKGCATPNYIEHFLILVFAVTGCTSISVFTFLLGIPIETTSSAIGLKIGAVIAELKDISL